jgi:hypothetical protein
VIRSRIARLEARYQVDPQDKVVTPADVQGWRDRGIPVPDCHPAGESLKQWLEQCSDEALRMFMALHEQGFAGDQT